LPDLVFAGDFNSLDMVLYVLRAAGAANRLF
jgi:hypothetical protein